MGATPGGYYAGLSCIKVQLKARKTYQISWYTYELIVESCDTSHFLTNASRTDTLHHCSTRTKDEVCRSSAIPKQSDRDTQAVSACFAKQEIYFRQHGLGDVCTSTVGSRETIKACLHSAVELLGDLCPTPTLKGLNRCMPFAEIEMIEIRKKSVLNGTVRCSRRSDIAKELR